MSILSNELLANTAYWYSDQVVYWLHSNIVTWTVLEVPSTNLAHSLTVHHSVAAYSGSLIGYTVCQSACTSQNLDMYNLNKVIFWFLDGFFPACYQPNSHENGKSLYHLETLGGESWKVVYCDFKPLEVSKDKILGVC